LKYIGDSPSITENCS